MSLIYKSFLLINFIRHLRTSGLQVLLSGRIPSLSLLSELAKIGGVKSLKMTPRGPIYKGQRIQEFEKQDFKLIRKSFTFMGPRESYMVVAEGFESSFASEIYIGKKRYAANINQLRSIVLDLQDRAFLAGDDIRKIVIKHVHPSLEIIGRSGVVLHPLTSADIDVREKLELLVGRRVEVQALTPSLIKYSR